MFRGQLSNEQASWTLSLLEQLEAVCALLCALAIVTNIVLRTSLQGDESTSTTSAPVLDDLPFGHIRPLHSVKTVGKLV
jgi:hypothetical protein